MNPCTECDTNWCRAKAEGKDCPAYYYEPPRPHGEWIAQDEFEAFFKCSNCGIMIDNDFSIWRNFCPNCGADMRAEEGTEK